MQQKSNNRLVNIISFTLGIRLLSMLIIAPFISVFALELKGSTPVYTGLALGIFGLTQSLLQIPFGILSDRVGYKKMMVAGLIMLIVGLYVAAISKSIVELIVSRALQGSGAIVTVGYSWISSVTDGNERDKALTRLGSVIATFTMLSYVIGAIVHIFLDVNQMFLFSAALVALCLIWVISGTKAMDLKLRNQRVGTIKQESIGGKVFTLSNILKSSLLTLNNLLMMAFFFIFPIEFSRHLSTSSSWMVLVPAILIAIGALNLFSKYCSKGRDSFLLALLFTLLGIGFLLIYFNKLSFIIIGTILIMSGSFSISTIVPMLFNKHLDKSQLGKGNGVMVSFQYFGSFMGAALTGLLWQFSHDMAYLFLGAVVALGIFLVFMQKK